MNSSTPAESTANGSDARGGGAACPAVASVCESGCFPLQLQPVDVARACRLPPQTVGCSPFDMIGPPGIGCSVTPDGMVWISMEYGRHPAGRLCSHDELQFANSPNCPGGR